MRRLGIAVAVATVIAFWPALGHAQATERARASENDHSIVFEIGAAGDWSDEGASPGGTFAFEITPIERWLELEVGIAAIRGRDGTEWPIDVLFKKPWRVSRTFEFMIGVGPEVIHDSGTNGGTFWGVSSVLDFMFWPGKNVGWYVEPGYEITQRGGSAHHGFGIAAGVLIGR